MKQRNSCVDQVRFLAACSVVVNHGHYAHKLPLMILAGRWTVPFFFMLSGFYYCKRLIQQSRPNLFQAIKPVLVLLVMANGFYVLFVSLTNGSLHSLATHFTWLTGSYFHLWFLNSLLVGYLVLWTLLRYRLESLLPYLAIVLIGIALSLDAYHQQLGLLAHPLYARSLLSIPFLSIGFLLAKHNLDNRLSKWVARGLIPAGMGLQLLEAHRLAPYGPAWVKLTFLGGTVLLAIGMVLFALQGAFPRSGILSKCGRRYSVPLYLYHPMMYYGISRIMAVHRAGEFWYWVSPVLTLLLLIGLLMVVERQIPALFSLLSGQWRTAKAVPVLAQKPV